MSLPYNSMLSVKYRQVTSDWICLVLFATASMLTSWELSPFTASVDKACNITDFFHEPNSNPAN